VSPKGQKTKKRTAQKQGNIGAGGKKCKRYLRRQGKGNMRNGGESNVKRGSG